MPISLNEKQIKFLKAITNDGNSDVWKGYSFLEAIAIDKAAPSNILFWLQKAQNINANNRSDEANDFIRGVTYNGLRYDGFPSIDVQAASDAIGRAVFADIFGSSSIPDVSRIIQKDATTSVTESGQTLAGWGGAFYYWNEMYGSTGRTIGDTIKYTDSSNTDINYDEYDKFIAVSAKSVYENSIKFGVSWQTALAFHNAQVPWAETVAIGQRIVEYIAGAPWGGSPDNIDGYYPVDVEGEDTQWWLGPTQIVDATLIDQLNERRSVRQGLVGAFNDSHSNEGKNVGVALAAMKNDSNEITKLIKDGPNSAILSTDAAINKIGYIVTKFADNLQLNEDSLNDSQTIGLREGIINLDQSGFLRVEIIDNKNDHRVTNEMRAATMDIVQSFASSELGGNENFKKAVSIRDSIAKDNAIGNLADIAKYYSFEAKNGQSVTVDLSKRTDGVNVVGGAGEDKLTGGKGADILIGGASKDILFGGDGRDLLIGGAGQDEIRGGRDADILHGGADADRFYVGPQDRVLDVEADDRAFLGGEELKNLKIGFAFREYASFPDDGFLEGYNYFYYGNIIEDPHSTPSNAFPTGPVFINTGTTLYMYLKDGNVTAFHNYQVGDLGLNAAAPMQYVAAAKQHYDQNKINSQFASFRIDPYLKLLAQSIAFDSKFNDTDASNDQLVVDSALQSYISKLNSGPLGYDPKVDGISPAPSSGNNQQRLHAPERAGVQNLNQNQAPNLVEGTSGFDLLTGTGLDDEFDGAGGIDLLLGGEGNDAYVYTALNGGRYYISESTDEGTADVLRMTDFGASDVLLVKSGTDLIVQFMILDESGYPAADPERMIYVFGQFDANSRTAGIESIEFAGGIVWDRDQIDQSVNFVFPEPEETVAPTDIVIVGNQIIQNEYISGTFVTKFDAMTTTPDQNVYFELLNDFDGKFYVTYNGELYINPDAEFEPGGPYNYDLQIRATNEHGQWLDKQLTVTLNESPDIAGTEHADHIAAASGGSVVVSYGGDDLLVGGAGDDFLVGGRGSDTYLIGTGAGQDTVVEIGDAQAVDKIQFEGGILPTDISLEVVDGIHLKISLPGTGQVLVLQQFSAETPRIEEFRFGNNTVWSAKELHDELFSRLATGGDDLILGLAVADKIIGGAGDDTIDAYDGDDIIDGGQGDDTLFGGAGYDIFKYGSSSFGHDIIKDFGAGWASDDAIEFNTSVFLNFASVMAAASQQGSDVVIVFDPNNSIALKDVSLSDLRESDFRFVSPEPEWNVIAADPNGGYLTGGDGNDHFIGDVGNDTFYGGKGNDLFDGGDGYDQVDLDGSETDWTFSQNPTGSITAIRMGWGTLNLTNIEGIFFYGSSNWHSLPTLVPNYINTIHASENGGYVQGTDGNDRFFGAGGDDTFYAAKGNDVFEGGAGLDQLDLDGLASDWTFTRNVDGSVTAERTGWGSVHATDVEAVYFYGDGQWSAMSMLAPPLGVTLNGTLGDDQLVGTAGNDEINGLAGNDDLTGGDGNDILNGGGGHDLLLAGDGDDILNGDDNDLDVGNDILSAGAGNDILNGFAGNDILYGEAGNDTINGGAGDDQLYGLEDDDTLTGGAGNDVFVFAAGFGHDTITDFVVGAASDDVIEFDDAVFADLSSVLAAASQVGTDTVISYDANNTITLKNVTMSNLHQDDFRFV